MNHIIAPSFVGLYTNALTCGDLLRDLYANSLAGRLVIMSSVQKDTPPYLDALPSAILINNRSHFSGPFAPAIMRDALDLEHAYDVAALSVFPG